MSIDPSKYTIPNRHNLSYRQQIEYVKNMLFDAENDARDVARAEAWAKARTEAQKARERLALERDPSDPKEPDVVQEASHLVYPTADEAEGAAGSEDAEEGADEFGQHAHAEAALELAPRHLGAEKAACSEDAEDGVHEVERQPPSEDAADLPHLTAAEAEEGTDPEEPEEDADGGEPPQAEEASEPAHSIAEDVEEAVRATTDARPPRLARKATRPARKPAKRKQAAKVAASRAPNGSRRRSHAVTVPPPPTLAPLLTAPALLPGEDPAEYSDLLFRVIECVRPADAIEMMLVHDFVGRSWEVARYQRLKTALLTSRTPNSLHLLLRELQVGDPERQALVRGWVTGDLKAKGRVRAHLAAAGWDESVIHARSFVTDHKTIEAIEGQLMTAETCRAVAWRQLIRHRDDLAHRFQRPQALIEAACSHIDEQAAEDA